MKRALIPGLAIIGLLALLWAIYALFVPEPEDLLPDRLSRRPGDAELAPTLAAGLGAPILPGNRVELLVNGDRIFPPMIEAIEGAETSISFLTYIYWQGDIAIRFADALSDACRREVEVRILLDAFGAAKMRDALIAQMREAGCHIAWFHPLHWYTLRRFNNRTHRRALVVDGRVGFTGGVGIAEEWTGNAGDPAHWRDDHFRIEGPAVRHLHGSFAENWRTATGEVLVLAEPPLYPPLEAAGNAEIVPVFGTPGGTVSQVAFLYWLLFATARERVDIATPYFVPDDQLKASIEEAARRGIQIRLLIPNDLNDVWIVRYASRTFYRDLLEAGVRVFEYQPTMMHVKTVTVDDAWSVVGTANFDNRSFELNYEIVLAVQDEALVSGIRRTFEEDLAESREITLEDVEAWSPVTRALDHLALLLREQI